MKTNTKEKYYCRTKNFETLKCNILDETIILLDDSCDPHVNFLNKKFLAIDKPHLIPGKFHNFLDN